MSERERRRWVCSWLVLDSGGCWEEREAENQEEREVDRKIATVRAERNPREKGDDVDI